MSVAQEEDIWGSMEGRREAGCDTSGMNATQCKRRRGKQADHELHHRDANAQGSTSLAVPIELRLTSRWQLQPFPAACLHEEVVLAGAARVE